MAAEFLPLPLHDQALEPIREADDQSGSDTHTEEMHKWQEEAAHVEEQDRRLVQ